MWWSGLPGLETPNTPSRTLADQAVAIACADRARPTDPATSGPGSKAGHLAHDFYDWLTEADSGTAHARRLALCMACNNVTPETTRGDILSTAKWLYKTLVS